MSTTNDDVWTSIQYMIRDQRHEEEKPYFLMYDMEGTFPSNNAEHEPRDVLVRNFRPFQSPQNFHEYGFAVEKLSKIITNSVFGTEQSIKAEYYPCLEKLLRQKFPDAVDFHIREHTVRQRRSFSHVPTNLATSFDKDTRNFPPWIKESPSNSCSQHLWLTWVRYDFD